MSVPIAGPPRTPDIERNDELPGGQAHPALSSARLKREWRRPPRVRTVSAAPSLGR